MRPVKVTERKLTVAIDALIALEECEDFEAVTTAAERKTLGSTVSTLGALKRKATPSPSRSGARATPKAKAKPAAAKAPAKTKAAPKAPAAKRAPRAKTEIPPKTSKPGVPGRKRRLRV